MENTETENEQKENGGIPTELKIDPITNHIQLQICLNVAAKQLVLVGF